MKITALAAIAALFAGLISACGTDGTSSSPSSAQSVSPPVVQPPPAPPPPPPHPLQGPVVFIGDSVTFRWTNLTQLAPDGINAGIGSNTTPMMLARFDTDVLAYHPSVVVIEGGLNDVVLLPNPTVDDIAEMASRARAAGAQVVLCALTPANKPYDFVGFSKQIKALASAYQYEYVDYYSAMILPDGTQNPDLFIADGVHPTAAGYQVMWSVLKPTLVKLGVAVSGGL